MTAPPGLWRRLAAMCYDALLLAGLLVLASAPLPLISEPSRALGWGRLAVQGYLLGVSFVFLGWFWVHGGQTLGMRAWRLRVVQDSGDAVGWSQAALRFVAALLSWAALGMGFVWVLLDPAGKAWHDHLSRTRLIVLPKPGGTDRHSVDTPQHRCRDAQEEQGGD